MAAVNVSTQGHHYMSAQSLTGSMCEVVKEKKLSKRLTDNKE